MNWPNHQPVLALTPTGIDQIANRYWRIWQYMHINYVYPFCRHSEITNRYWPTCQPVLVKLPTGIGQIAYQYWLNCQLVSLVFNFINTGWRFGQYRLAITGEGTFSKIWAGLRSKSGILKTWGVLELCLDIGSRIKKIDLSTEVSL